MKKSPKTSRSMNMKTRSFQMEALEPRHLLSALPLTATTGDSNVFVVDLQGEQGSTQDQYMVVNIESSSGVTFGKGDIDVTGGQCDVIRTSTDGAVTSVLMKMGLGSSYTFTLNEQKMANDEQITVFITVAGDSNNDGFVSKNEYYTHYGQVLYDTGLDSRSVMLYKRMYGIDITSSHFNTLYDLNSNGKLDSGEFSKVIPEFTDHKEITAEVSFRPQVKSGTLRVNDKTAPVVQGTNIVGGEVQTDGMVISGTVTESDASMPVMAKISYGGKTVDINLTDLTNPDTKHFELDLEDVMGTDFPGWDNGNVEVILYGGKSETDPADGFSMNFAIDLTTPDITAVETLTVKGNDAIDGVFYANVVQPSIKIQMTVTDKEAFLTYLADLEKGVYVDLVFTTPDMGTNKGFSQTVQLSASMLTWNESTFTFEVVPSQKLLYKRYSLDILPHNLAGNASTGKQEDVDLFIDTTTPTVAYNDTTLNTKTQPSPHDEDVPAGAIYTDGTYTGSSAQVQVNVTSGCSFNVYYSLDGTSYTKLDVNATIIPLGTLNYGENTLSYYVVNYAQSTSETVTTTLVKNAIPTVTTAGETLQEKGFTQLEKDGVDKKTLDVSEQFTDDGPLASTPYEVTVDYADGVPAFLTSASIDENGVLSFSYDKTKLSDDTPTLKANITLTCVDEYGEKKDLAFELTYTLDNMAPVADDLVLTGNTAWNADLTGKDYTLQTSTGSQLDGTIYDISKMVSWGLGLYAPDGTQLAKWETTSPDTDITETNFTYNGTTKAFQLNLGAYLTADGNYTLKVWGKDVHGNQSTEATAQETTIVLDSVVPGITPAITLKKTGTSETIVNTQQPQFTFSHTGALNDLDKENGVWLQIWMKKTTETEYSLYAQGEYTDDNAIDWTYFQSDLTTGSYDHRLYAIDAAGNKTSEVQGTLDVDLVNPGVAFVDSTKFKTVFPSGEELPADSYYTEESKVTFQATDNNAGPVIVTIGTTTYNTEQVGPLTLAYGENVFTIKTLDVAGNETTDTITIYCNHVPVSLPDTETVLDQTGAEYDGNKLAKNLFTLDASGTYTYEYSIPESLDEIVTVENNNILWDFSDWAGDATKYSTTAYVVTVTVTDAFGYEETSTLTLRFLADDSAPVANFDAPTWDTVYEKAEGIDFATKSDAVSLTGKIYDASTMLSFGVGIQKADGTVTEIYTTDSPYENGTGTGFTYDGTTQAFTLDLSSYLAAGEDNYKVIVWGKDDVGHETTSADGQKTVVDYDKTVPGFTMTNVLKKTGTSSTIVNTQQPQFEPTLVGDLNEQDVHNGVWVEIYVTGGDYSTPTLYARGKYASSALVYAIDSLADGDYTFTCRVVDAANNEKAGNDLNVTVDTVRPTITFLGEVTVKPCPDTDITDDYTNENTVKFIEFNSSKDNVTYYVSNGTETKSPIEGDVGLMVEFDLAWGKNTFTIWCEDTAGNVSEKPICVLHSNDIPTVATAPDDVTIDHTATQILLSKATVEGAFTDSTRDLAAGDSLTYYFKFDAATGSGVESIAEGTLTLVGESYVVNLTVTDQEALDVSEKFGKLTLFAKDEYLESVSTSLDVWKANLNPRMTEMDESYDYGDHDIELALADYLYDETAFANLTVNSIQFQRTDGTVLHSFTLAGEDAEYDASTGTLLMDSVIQSYFGKGKLVIHVTDKDYINNTTPLSSTLTGDITINWVPSFQYKDDTLDNPVVKQVEEDSADGTVDLKEWTLDQWSSSSSTYIGGLTKPTITWVLDGNDAINAVFDTFEIDAETGVISYSLKENANGTVAFTVHQSVNDEETNDLSFQFDVEAVADDPVGSSFTGNFTLKGESTSQTFNILTLGECKDPDGGTLTVKSITVGSTTIHAGESSTSADNRFTFALGTDGVLTVTQKDDTDTAVNYAFSYTLSAQVGTETPRTALVEGSIIRCAAIAQDFTDEVRTRDDEEATYNTVDILEKLGLSSDDYTLTGVVVADDFTDYGGFKTVGVEGNTAQYTLEEGTWGTGTLTYTLTKNGTTETYTATITVSVTPVNWAPTWATTPTDNTYVWTNSDGKTSYVLENVRALFQDFDTEVEDLTVMFNGNVEWTDDVGSYKYDATADTLTFTPTDPNYSTTGHAFVLQVTDTAVGTAAAKTANFNFKLVINHVVMTPVITEATPVEGTAGEEVSVVMDDYIENVTITEQETNTYLEYYDTDTTTWKTGTYTFTPESWGIYSFQIRAVNTANDGKLLYSNVYNVDVVVSGTEAFTDKSLVVSGALDVVANSATTTDITLSADTLIPVGTSLKTGSVLKAGSVLGAGTTISKNSTIAAGENDDPADWLTGVDAYYDDGDGVWVIDSDYTVPTGSVTLQANITLKKANSIVAAGTTLESGTLLKTGTIFSQDQTLTILDFSEAVAYYTNNQHCTNEYTVSLPEGVTITDAVLDTNGNSMSNFLSATVNAAGDGFEVTYKPYNLDQDRSNVVVHLTTSEGETLDVTLDTGDYKSPFTVKYVISSTEPAVSKKADSIEDVSEATVLKDASGTTSFYVQAWFQCNLPIYQDAFRKSGLLEQWSMMLSSDVRGTYSGFTDLDITYIESDDSETPVIDSDSKTFTLKFDNVLAYMTVNVADKPDENFVGSAEDGNFLRIGSFKVTATGAGSLSLSTKGSGYSNYSLGLVFDVDNPEKPYAIEGGITDESTQLVDDGVSVTVKDTVALKGTESAKETVVEGTGVYMSLVKDLTKSETVSELPASAAYLTEWDTSYVELWVNTQDPNVDLKNVHVDLRYNTEYFSATNVEYGQAVANGAASVITDAEGRVTGIGGDLTNAVTNADGFVLLARVKLESLNGDNVSADNVGAVKAGLVLENIFLSESNGAYIDPNTQVYVNTKIFPVVYDTNDDGVIGTRDLINFARQLGKSSADSTDPILWALDFDKNGSIGTRDLINLARNLGRTADSTNILYPERFMEQWIGSTVITTGDTSLGDMLDTTIGQWEDKLGEELDLQVQIIVKELDNDDLVLGQTLLVGVDDAGKPDTAVIYLDSDALGMGWYVSEDGLIPNEQYDLYTVLLHELGHALGLNSAYTGYTDVVNTENGTYTDADGNKSLVLDGHVVNAGDLMCPSLNPGERKEISDIDAKITSAARKQGGVVTEQVWLTAHGTVSAAMALASVETTSGIVPLNEWNTALLQAAEREVQRMEGLAADEALALLDAEIASPVTPSAVISGSDDELFADDEFESLLDEITLDNLSVTMDK